MKHSNHLYSFNKCCVLNHFLNTTGSFFHLFLLFYVQQVGCGVEDENETPVNAENIVVMLDKCFSNAAGNITF